MKMIVSTHNVKATKAIEDHLRSRIEKIEHLDHFVVSARVTLERDGMRSPEKQFSCAMQLTMPGAELFAEDVENDLYAAIDLSAKKIEQQLRKRHRKFKALNHKVAARGKRSRQEAGI